MGQTNVNEVTLEYFEKGTGEPVVFIHGSASDHRTWQHQLDEVGSHFRVITYSRRFHWPNQKIAEGEDYSMREHLEDLKDLLDALGAKPAHLVGHSYGALLSLALASEEPQYIQTLTLMEPPAITLFVQNSNSPKPAELLKLFLSRPRTALSVLKLGATGLGPAAKAAQNRDMEEAMRLFGRAALGAETFAQMSAERREQVFVNLTRAELTGTGYLPLEEHKLREVDIPILLLTGENSPVVFAHLMNRLEELLPNTKRMEIAGASHIMHEDNPEQFNTVLLDSLKQF